MKQKLTIKYSLLTMMLFVFAANTYSSPGKSKKHAASKQMAAQPEKFASPDLETLRTRITDDLMQPAVNNEKINRLIKTIQPDGSWPGINYKDTSRTGFQHSIHLENMLDLARAYKKKGSEFYENAAVKSTVSSALDFWIAHDFICENWWWNEMGTPNWMINTLLVLDDDLTEKQKTEGIRIASRASLTGSGARAGGDFVPIAGMVCKQGLFKRDDAFLAHALQVMTEQIVITPARGINPDMGFHHRTDNVTSIHTYGTNYVSAFAYWAVKTAGTKYALPSKALNLLVDYYVDGISKCLAYGIYPDPGAKNRDLSRKGEGSKPAGTELPENLLQTSDYRKKELEYLVQVRKDFKSPDQTWDKYFWHSSYFAHQRKNYYASVRMHSSRQNNMEEPYNEEGLKMHHVADGANFILRTGKEYADIFPVWDWQKIPGTTVVQRASMPPFKEIAKKGKSDFVGAVSDGDFGAAAFDFASVHDPLTARKAWFFFDKEYVCLGNSIKSAADDAVATTLNQCLLNKDVTVQSAGKVSRLDKGTHTMQNVDWVFHDSVGYIFPTPVEAHVGNATATGSWRQINHQASATDEKVEKDLFTLWLDHGIKPTDASYAYIVYPGVSQPVLSQYSKNANIQIVSNNAEVQAVYHKTLHMAQVVFYKEGTIALPGNISLTAESHCIVMLAMNGKQVTKMAASDPTQKLTALILKINSPVAGQGDNWQAVYDSKTGTSTIQVDLPKELFAGKSVVMQLQGK